ncbi:TIGR03086 family metal-binding protein [Phaeacidiphilus oryzae]|uniref:TIGR03086 family metal-binding protein n=1 Tax=Phaeacidiphilus oryzae TaxID=348818 RepID=UPI000AB24F11|nr:TIGR03086 family metal-binding protein [Phaeacidiphilus oryzae]
MPTNIPDLGPAARRLADLLGELTDDHFDRPTPCEKYTVGDLVDHVGGLALAFTAAATERDRGAGPGVGPGRDRPPTPSASALPPDWRKEFPRRLAALAEAWTDPAAWDGFTRVGGVDLPGGVAGRVALNELVIHTWDLTVATGVPYSPRYAATLGELDVCADVLAHALPAEQRPPSGGPFGPPVPVRADAPLLSRVLALSGRDPEWAP